MPALGLGALSSARIDQVFSRRRMVQICANATDIRLARRPRTREAARMDDIDPDLDELFLDAVDAVVLAAFERIGDNPDGRLRFFRELLAVARAAKGADS